MTSAAQSPPPSMLLLEWSCSNEEPSERKALEMAESMPGMSTTTLNGRFFASEARTQSALAAVEDPVAVAPQSVMSGFARRATHSSSAHGVHSLAMTR